MEKQENLTNVLKKKNLKKQNRKKSETKNINDFCIEIIECTFQYYILFQES